MKAPGDYALLHANGMPWAEVIAAVRAEAREDCAPECFHHEPAEYFAPQDDEGTRP